VWRDAQKVRDPTKHDPTKHDPTKHNPTKHNVIEVTLRRIARAPTPQKAEPPSGSNLAWLALY
jgi:hypothetical protein